MRETVEHVTDLSIISWIKKGRHRGANVYALRLLQPLVHDGTEGREEKGLVNAWKAHGSENLWYCLAKW